MKWFQWVCYFAGFFSVQIGMKYIGLTCKVLEN